MKTIKQVAVLNAAIITCEGRFELREITLDEAREIIRRSEGIISAVGHQSTAEIITDLLGVEIPMNRVAFRQSVGQQAIVFRLLERPAEGRILTRAEIETLGYKFQLLTRLE